MHRFRTPELFLGCFLTVAVFATGMLFQRQEQLAYLAQSASQQETISQGTKFENPDSSLTGSMWLTKDAAGFFTFWLVVVGLGQALLFYFQLRYMRESMKDAGLAATAARDAALAAKEQVELARSQIEVTKIGIFDLERAYLDSGPNEVITSFVVDPPSAQGFYRPGIDPMEVIIRVGINNTGRTRAAITRAYGEFSHAPSLGETPIYNYLIGTNYVTDLSLAANGGSQFPHDFRTRFVSDQFFFGFIEYTDIFKNSHTSRFCMRVMPGLQNGERGRLQLAGNDLWRECD